MKRIAAAAVVALSLAAAGFASGREEAAPPKPTAADLAWMAGTWIRSEGGSTFEETWLPPRGGSLAAVSRNVKGEKTAMFELSTVETAESGDLVLHIRHFGPGLASWKSEASGPGKWTLVESSERKAVFEDASKDFPRRIVYASAHADDLRAFLEGEREGKPMGMQFLFKRAK
ncbi:MAG: hypothetical protein HUU06_13010 [Planctomycetaceae bacterium]|nr:DUF6265 family protein [Planctomycetota bacterium]NUN53686.1 hypothetical protein [Planctomycetaceae bacterium]